MGWGLICEQNFTCRLIGNIYCVKLFVNDDNLTFRLIYDSDFTSCLVYDLHFSVVLVNENFAVCVRLSDLII